jgi:hypothetical protein
MFVSSSMLWIVMKGFYSGFWRGRKARAMSEIPREMMTHLMMMSVGIGGLETIGWEAIGLLREGEGG